jgi:hypothetical protein
MLLLIFIFLLLFNIYQVNCYLNNYENEEISLLILAVADNNGNIAHSKQGYLWVYNGKNNNRPRYETILDIIPELRKKYDQAYRNQFGPNNKIPTPRTIIYSDVDNYFHDNLYDAAVRTYNKYFNNVGNTIGSGRKVTAEDIINSYDLFGRLTTENNNGNNGNNGNSVKPLNIFDPSIDVEILFPDNEVFYNVIASYIRENDKYDKKTFNGFKYLNNKQTKNIPLNVIHKIAELCISKRDECRNYFVNHESNIGTNFCCS